MHVSEIINRNIIRISKINRLISVEGDVVKVRRLRSVLEAIKSKQIELISIELRLGGPFKGLPL